MERSRFGSGVYDIATAAYLLGTSQRTLLRWSTPSSTGKPALVAPSHGWAFSFHDLLSLAVTAVLRQRDIPPDGIRTAVGYLQESLQVPRPFAHRDVVEGLTTVGKSIFMRPDIDITAGGQIALMNTVRDYLRPVDYGANLLAQLWRVSETIILDPSVQAGRPCIEGSRVTTDVVASRLQQGEPARDVAEDLGIEFDQALKARQFERRLQSGKGLALVA